ncbi:MAG: hypothetical protein HYZ87_02465 [Candidatus Omnitrophica bacterium]|nr:hypothetical protein [Candidatus Omnitrophota bacterium]
MESKVAYEEIRRWAAKLKLPLKETTDPASRVQELAGAIAALRLSSYPDPPEPCPQAVEALLRDYFVEKGEGSGGGKGATLEHMGKALENFVCAAAEKKVAALENQPYFGCHRTADSKPPVSHTPPKENLGLKP